MIFYRVGYARMAAGGAIQNVTQTAPNGGACCTGCTEKSVKENWYLRSARQTAEDIAVTVRKVVKTCRDTNAVVSVDCEELAKTGAGVQGLKGLGCGNLYSNRM